MSDQETLNQQQTDDPFARMVQFYDDWTKAWSGAAGDVASSKGFADMMAQQMDSSLSAAQLMRRQVGDMMEQSLQQMNLPTRKDIVNLGERLTNIEMRLDDMEAKLDQVLVILKKE